MARATPRNFRQGTGAERTRPASAFKRKWLRRGQRGQSLVELALVMPMLLVILCAVAEFGFIMSNDVALVHAAHDAARAGAAPGCGSSSSCEISNANAQAAQAQGTFTSCSSQTVTPSVGGTPQTITVAISCNYTPVTPLGSLIGLIGGWAITWPPTLSASTTMKTEP